MTISLRWKLIFAFVLVFIAGGLCSHLFCTRGMWRVFPVPLHSGALKEHMREHLRRELNLTPQQLEQVAPMIDSTAARLETIRMETNRKVLETFAEQRQQFATVLTPEQQEKLKAMERRHQRQLEHHGLERPPAPPGEQSSPD